MAPPIVHEVLRSPGDPLEPGVREEMEQRFGHDFSRVRVHRDARAAKSARAVSALAYTVGNHVAFDEGYYAPGTSEGRRLLAHELAHVVQQGPLTAPPSGLVVAPQDDALERKAVEVEHVGRKSRVGDVGGRSRGARVQRQGNTPRDRMVVERARRRLPLLQQYLAEWSTREARRLSLGRERDELLERRAEMDRVARESGADLTEALSPGTRERTERANWARLNRRPVSVDVTDRAIVFRVRFHVRFEDASMEGRSGELVAALNEGIEIIWNHRFRRGAFQGRAFRIEPDITLVPAEQARDLTHWLVTVRPTDDAPIQYPGCSFDQGPEGVPTSAADPLCDGGVMSIPPRHIDRPGVLGHELLHLFGLIDRYMNLTHNVPGQPPRSVNEPIRETGGRPDPLGTQEGTILAEDLAFILDQLGVYEQEASRGLAVLRRLEREGLTRNAVIGEIHRLEEIIRLGYDPRSLVRPRTDFRDRILRSVEDL